MGCAPFGVLGAFWRNLRGIAPESTMPGSAASAQMGSGGLDYVKLASRGS